VTSLALLPEYLPIMVLRFHAMLYSNFGKANSDAGHIKCSRGSQISHPCFRGMKHMSVCPCDMELLSIVGSAFATENQSLILKTTYFSYYVGIISCYSNRIICNCVR